MKILVTGGAGFIGSTIADEYIRDHHEVWIIDNESSGKRANIHKDANFRHLDIRRASEVDDLVKRQQFDVVNHHAAQIDVRRSVLDPLWDAEVNVLGTLNILNACRRHSVKKVIFASSGGTIYGECHRPANESDPERPLSPYGVAKLAAEKYIQAFFNLFALNFTIFRYANVYGPRQDPFGEAGVVAIFSSAMIAGKPTKIYGDGSQTRDFVFVGDVARANLLALRAGDNEILNIGSGLESSVNDLHRVMRKVTGCEINPTYEDARTGELRRSVLDVSKTQKVLSWSPQTTLESGLTKTVEFFRQPATKH